jgi:hypothetical protein
MWLHFVCFASKNQGEIYDALTSANYLHHPIKFRDLVFIRRQSSQRPEPPFAEISQNLRIMCGH